MVSSNKISALYFRSVKRLGSRQAMLEGGAIAGGSILRNGGRRDHGSIGAARGGRQGAENGWYRGVNGGGGARCARRCLWWVVSGFTWDTQLETVDRAQCCRELTRTATRTELQHSLRDAPTSQQHCIDHLETAHGCLFVACL
jgi:hypothetical protein